VPVKKSHTLISIYTLSLGGGGGLTFKDGDKGEDSGQTGGVKGGTFDFS